MDNQPSININGVDIDWNPQKGTFNFFGLPAALFWINPSLLTMLQPLAQEVGYNLFRLEVAASASEGTEEDYQNMVTTLGDTFVEGFHNWGSAVGSAGWGTFEIVEFQPEQKKARVRVCNTWELLMQKDLPQRWGCPFIQGKIIGIFNQALKTNCWADEVIICYDEQNPYVEFDIHPSSKTISTEIDRERRLAMQQKERALAIEIEKKTRQLNEQKIKAEAANHAKTKFLDAMSHELRTPLNGVLGFAQLMAASTKNPLDERQQNNMKQILESGNNMLSLVNNLLLFAEVGVDVKNVVLQALAPKPALQKLLEIIQPLAQKRAITLVDKTPAKLPLIVGDQDYFREILSSFLINAVSFIPEQGHVTVRCELVKPGFQRFIVCDDGPGIAAEHHGTLFEAFERLDHQTGAISGAGVGLSIAKLMAQHMGGEVGFNNNSDAGVSFWVDLPLEE